MKKSIYQVLLVKRGKTIAEQTNIYKESYEDDLGSKFKISLYASFHSKEDMKYLNFIINLYKINKKYNLNYFDMILRFNDGSKINGIPTIETYFDDQFFNEIISPDQCSRIFICGNPVMNKLIPEICLRNEIDKEKICLI